MIRNLVQLAEIFAVLLCMSALYGRKLKFDIYAVVLIILDVFLFTGINEYGFPGYLVAFSYIGLFVYGILRYKAGTKCALINSFLAVVIVGALQLILYLPLFYLFILKYGASSIYDLSINAGCVAIVLLLGEKFKLKEISEFFIRKNKLVTGIVIFVLIALGWRIYLMNRLNELSGENYVQMLFFFLLFFLTVNEWQKSRGDAEKKKAELEMNELYYSAYDELITLIRERQHDLKNHISAIKGMSFIIDDHEELIVRLRNYCDSIVEKNAVSKVLLNVENPLIAGFLFCRMQEAEAKEIRIRHKINLKECDTVSEYELVEILGILLDNAIEALCNSTEKEKEINILVEQGKDRISITVANVSDVLSIGEMEKFWEKDISSKGKGRGIGLYKLKHLVNIKSGEIICYNEPYDGRNYLNFNIILPLQKGQKLKI